MLAPTHLLAAHLAYLSASWWVGHEPAVPEAAVAVAAGLAPDIDTRSSVAGRLAPWLSAPLERATGHRTVTHSGLAVLVVAALAWPLPPGYTLAVVAGFASHGILDMMTPGGVAWFWPARARCVLPGNPRWRMEAMGRGELAFAVILAALSAPALAAAERGVGILGSVRDAMGDVAEARRHYDAHRGEAVWHLALEGQDNRRFEPVEGRYRIIGPYRADGFIVAAEGGPVSVCRAEACDWYAERAVIERGAERAATTRRLTAEDTDRAAVAEALAPLEQAGRVYLRGELTGEVAAAPPVIEATGEGAELHYATPDQLHAAADEIEALRAWVQVRHEPGRPVPELRRPEPEPEPALPERLERHLP